MYDRKMVLGWRKRKRYCKEKRRKKVDQNKIYPASWKQVFGMVCVSDQPHMPVVQINLGMNEARKMADF